MLKKKQLKNKKQNVLGTQQANKHTCFLELCEDSIQPAFELYHERLSGHMQGFQKGPLLNTQTEWPTTISVDATKRGTLKRQGTAARRSPTQAMPFLNANAAAQLNPHVCRIGFPSPGRAG